MYRRARRWTYEPFEPRSGGDLGYYTDWGIMVLILANVVAVTLRTVDSLAVQFGELFHWFEVLSVVVLSVEYLGRVLLCVEAEGTERPVRDRLRFATRPLIVVDCSRSFPSSSREWVSGSTSDSSARSDSSAFSAC